MKNLKSKSFANMSEREKDAFIKRSFTAGIMQTAFSARGLADTTAHYLIYNLTDACEAVGILGAGATDKQKREKYLQYVEIVRDLLEKRGAKLGKDAGSDFENQVGVWAQVVTDERGEVVCGSAPGVGLLVSSSPAYKKPILDENSEGIFYTKEFTLYRNAERIKGFDGSPMEGADVLSVIERDIEGKKVPSYLCRWIEKVEYKERRTYQAYYKTYYNAAEGASVLVEIINNAQKECWRARFNNCSIYSFEK